MRKDCRIMAVILGSAVVIALMLRALAMDERPVALGFLSGSKGHLNDHAFPPETCRFQNGDMWINLEIWRFTYLSQNKTSLLHTAKLMAKTPLDIELAHIPFIDFNYLHEMFNVGECVDSSKVSEYGISDWLWYLGMKNITATCEPEKRLTRNECTSKREVARFLADVVKHVGWRYVSLLYETDYDTEASVLTDVLSDSGVMINQYSIQADKSNFPSINTSYFMVNSAWRHYVLLGNLRTIKATFQELNAFDEPGLGRTAMRTFSMWLVWGRDVTLSTLEDEVSAIGNVAILERPGCLESTKSDLRSVLKKLCFPWIAQMSETTSCPHRDNEDRAISSVSRAIWGILSNEGSQKYPFRLSTAMWKPEGRRFQTVFEGTRNILLIKEGELFPNTQYGLNNMEMRVTTLEWPLYVTITNDSEGQLHYGGMCMDLLREMSNQLNFSYTMQKPLDGEWGRVLKGKWTGLVGDIVYHKADLIFAPVSTQEERVAVMDFTISFFTDYNVIMMRMPDKDEARWKLLLRPLDWPVLVVIACLFPAVTFSLWFCERFSPFYDHIRRRPLFPGLHHFHECTWYMFGAMLAKCGTVLPKADSGRTIVTFWWLFIVLLVATYCGNLMAFLTVTRDRKPFNTIAEMLEQDEYIWGTNNGTYLLETLRVSRDSEYRQMWKAMETFSVQYPWVLHPSFPEQVKRVEKGGYAFMTDSAAADITIADNCELVKADETFMMYQYGVGLQKNSAYTRMFSEGIRAITEAGLIEMWKQRWWPKSAPCPAFLQTEARQIMFLDIQSSFYILIGGIVVSAIVCSAEILHNKWKTIFTALKKTKQ